MVTNNHNVTETGSESVASGVSDVSNLVRTWMLFEGLEVAYSTNVISTSDGHNSVILEFDNSTDFSGLEVVLDRVIDLNVWVWVSDGSSVVGDNMWDLGLADSLSDDLAELETSFFVINSMGNESTLGVQEHSEVFVGLFNSNNVHGTQWESWISSDFTINLDETFSVSNDLLSLLPG